jgi:hypothetical protein
MRLRFIPAIALLAACGGDLPDERANDLDAPDLTSDTPDAAPDMEPDEAPDLAPDMAPDVAPDAWPVYELPPLPPLARPAHPLDDVLTVDQLTMRCTHNSYHIKPAKPLFEEHDYTHAPLIEQAESLGVRAFELDIQPLPGMPVSHIPGIDPLSTCDTLHRCLSELSHWSLARPGHHLLVVWIEIKDDYNARKFKEYDGLDATIRAVFPPERLYTPDDLLRGLATQREALKTLGWPTLGETRDRVMFALINSGERHKMGYLRPDSSLSGRVLHLRAGVAELEQPWAAIAKIDDPFDATASINAALDAGLLIASNVGSAKHDDATNVARRQAARDIGVHMRCDDYPAQVPERSSWLELGDGAPTLCNAISADGACTPEAIEALGVHDAP